MKNFYNTSNGLRSSRPSTRSKTLHLYSRPRHQATKEAPSTKHRKTLQLPPTLRLFWRQADALEYATHSASNLCVFAYEAKSLGTEGQRRYLVAAFHEFANMYRKVPQSKRHVYEVIPENTPCRLYFDLEFKKTLNPTIDESRAVRILETFIQYICYQVQLHFRLSINRTNVLDLDSSSDSKFSRHLIFHLPGAAFENNKEAGSFVHYVCDQLRVLRQASPGKGSSISETLEPVYHDLFPVPAGKQSSAPCPKAHCLMELFVKDSEDQAVLFCDEAVYSKNRNFRLHLSTKLGCLDRCLRIAKENTFKSMFESQRHRQSTQHINILMDSLVSYVRFHDNIRILTFESPCSKSASKLAHPQPISPGYSASDGYSQSPFPNVDRYVVNEWTKGGIVPIIRKWTYFPQGSLYVHMHTCLHVVHQILYFL